MPAATTLTEALAPIRATPSRSAVLLDLDGTLAPIVRHADDAHVPEWTRASLSEIAGRYGLVACVSGRRASDARRILAIGRIVYLGSHGSELLRPGAAEPELDPELARWTGRVREFAATQADDPELRRLRVRLEDKGPIWALHWRGVPDEAAAHAAVEEAAGRAEAAGLHVHRGRKVIEIRPPVRIDKGAGITALLRSAELDAALYAGDDRTDLDAFRALDELVAAGELRAAVRIGVASDEGPAELVAASDVVVDGPAGMLAVLEALLQT